MRLEQSNKYHFDKKENITRYIVFLGGVTERREKFKHELFCLQKLLEDHYFDCPLKTKLKSEFNQGFKAGQSDDQIKWIQLSVENESSE